MANRPDAINFSYCFMLWSLLPLYRCFLTSLDFIFLSHLFWVFVDYNVVKLYCCCDCIYLYVRLLNAPAWFLLLCSTKSPEMVYSDFSLVLIVLTHGSCWELARGLLIFLKVFILLIRLDWSEWQICPLLDVDVWCAKMKPYFYFDDIVKFIIKKLYCWDNNLLF